jgi:hypothetical protein
MLPTPLAIANLEQALPPTGKPAIAGVPLAPLRDPGGLFFTPPRDSESDILFPRGAVPGLGLLFGAQWTRLISTSGVPLPDPALTTVRFAAFRPGGFHDHGLFTALFAVNNPRSW